MVEIPMQRELMKIVKIVQNFKRRKCIKENSEVGTGDKLTISDRREE
jgi:hypothetical protein